MSKAATERAFKEVGEDLQKLPLKLIISLAVLAVAFFYTYKAYERHAELKIEYHFSAALIEKVKAANSYQSIESFMAWFIKEPEIKNTKFEYIGEGFDKTTKYRIVYQTNEGWFQFNYFSAPEY